MAVTIAPFAVEHLDPAVHLLAARHRVSRVCAPDLPPQYEDPAAVRAVVQDLLTEEGMSGVVAPREGTLAGFLLGAPWLLAPTHHLAVWVRPRAVQIPFAGHAVDGSDPGTLYARLYAALAAR